jgi:hypothetical protein
MNSQESVERRDIFINAAMPGQGTAFFDGTKDAVEDGGGPPLKSTRGSGMFARAE